MPLSATTPISPSLLARRLLQWLGLAILAFALAYAAVLWTRATGRAAAVWPLNAVFLIIGLRGRAGGWLAVLSAMLVGNGIANLANGDSLPLALGMAGDNLIETVIVAAVIAGGRPNQSAHFLPVGRLIGAAIVGSAASAIIAFGLLTLGEGAQLALLDMAIWFAADALGLVLFAPLAWALTRRMSPVRFRNALSQASAPLIILVVVTTAVFWQSEFPLLFLVAPAAVYLAARSGPLGVGFGGLAVTVLAMGFSLSDHGPTSLIDADTPVRLLVMQGFLAVTVLTSMIVAASTARQQHLIARLRAQQARLKRRDEQARVREQQNLMAESMSRVGHWSIDVASGSLFWSPEVYRIHGLDPEVHRPRLEEAINYYAPEDRARVSEAVEFAMAVNQPWQFDADLITASGGRVRVRAAGECQLNSDGEVKTIFGVFKDITEDDALLRQVQEQKALYKLLADNSSDVIARYKADGVFEYLSPAVGSLLGYSPAELVGRRTFEIIDPSQHAHVENAFRKGLIEGGSFTVSYQARRKDGTTLWLEARPTPAFDTDGNVTGFVDTVRDVTERREREIELAEARHSAETAARTKADFLSNMSHEIRTPLNAILGFTDLLAETVTTEEERRYADRITSAGKSLLHVVNDILDFSKIEAGRMTIENRPYSPSDVAAEVIDLIPAAYPSCSVDLTLNVDRVVASHYFGDEVRFKQILLNVIGNAVKFTRKGLVRVDVTASNKTLCVKVEDTGPGIPTDRLDALFEGFSQADESISRNFGGSGLGLSISRSLARLMGGDLILNSTLGHGTTVTLVLPARKASRAEHVSTSTVSQNRPNGLVVMVVDDVEANRELLQLQLGRVGHDVRLFESGQAALDALALDGEAFDIILMDVQMPRMDGLEATRRIRRMDGSAASVPVVALTANVLPEQIAACREAGMDDHIGKPVNIDALVALLAKLSPAKTTAADDADSDNAMTALKRRYVDHLASVPDQLRALLDRSPAMDAYAGLAAQAHSIAGTSGSFGLDDVSTAAFDLEALALKATAGEEVDAYALTCAVERLSAAMTDAHGPQPEGEAQLAILTD
ncbi:PAS domain S-box-containing protein [Brevundimonas vesicularis]|uniref:histidine kinase n=1 Tax=Brevundimonas vesicularis TaxID=41276 RepID=A0A7W9FR41_BREVE|nr:ATP-binding protein [Brevundimonas vesicularis]MBB5770040.1 PAS domain S-box-containing protein [Brevundimonas vesicularis]